jgi:tRNA modification GTPase
MLHTDQETIVAQCTPKGSGALALLRLSGNDAVEIATTLSRLSSDKKLTDLPTHTIHYGTVIDANNAPIDAVLFLLMRAPKTFTGQDVVEISCHNNQFIIEQIIERAIACGARLAQEGEFSRRAYMNNKIDLIQAEAINELINANSHAGLKKSLAQLEGSFSNWITKIEKKILKILALSNASFEFIDDEISFGTEIRAELSMIIEDIQTLKKTFNQQQYIRQGVRIAIIGCVNAGKSSLFNSLLNDNRAIVTNIPGTTRDVVEAGMYHEGVYWTLIDTAGLRSTDDVIEKEGIRRSHEQAQRADIIILLFDGSRPFTAQEEVVYQELFTTYRNKIVVAQNKIDIVTTTPNQFTPHTTVAISSNEKTNIDKLHNLLKEKVRALFSHNASPFLLNQRHVNLLLGLERKLIMTQSIVSKETDYELISYELNLALEFLTELTGKTISEAAMDAIFKEFCIGK